MLPNVSTVFYNIHYITLHLKKSMQVSTQKNTPMFNPITTIKKGKSRPTVTIMYLYVQRLSIYRVLQANRCSCDGDVNQRGEGQHSVWAAAHADTYQLLPCSHVCCITVSTPVIYAITWIITHLQHRTMKV